jgi:hypothetical protein
MKDLIYGKRIRSFKVPNATKLIMGEDKDGAPENIRKYDAGHMKGKGYDTSINALLEIDTSSTFKRPATRPSSGAGARDGTHWCQQAAVGQ